MTEDDNTVVVDGVTYRWTTRVEFHEWAGSLSFENRGLSASYDIVEVTGDNGKSFSFRWDDYETKNRGWWRHARDQRTAVERGIRLGSHHAVSGPDLPAQDALSAAATVLGIDALGFVDSVLAVGCASWSFLGPMTDDWVASHADDFTAARGWLQGLLEAESDNDRVYRNRSAIELLIAMCTRVNVELGLDTTGVDVKLKTRTREDRLPAGLPTSHWWWRQGGSYDIDRNDPYDD